MPYYYSYHQRDSFEVSLKRHVNFAEDKKEEEGEKRLPLPPFFSQAFCNFHVNSVPLSKVSHHARNREASGASRLILNGNIRVFYIF